jgi:DUF4097 and DUF4098 domain-containing protein YvlB
MTMRLRFSFVAAAIALGAVSAAAQDDARIVTRANVKAARELARAYQGGPEETERFSRRVKIGRDGRVSVSNVSGDIVVTGGSGDEVSIEAVKRSRGSRDNLRNVDIVVDDRAGRVDVRTNYVGRNGNVSVDFTITVPSSAAVELSSVSGSLKISGVSGGGVRLNTVSGSVTASETPHVEVAKSVSGSITLSAISVDGDLNASSVSGTVTVNGVKARGLDLGSVSGNLVLTDASCERLTAKSVSGSVEYSGALTRNGRYDINSHSGSVRLALPASTGFDLTANTFSGAIRSEFAMTIGGDASRDVRGAGFSNHSIHGTVGDGSATITVRTFSGNIVITKR